MYSTPHVIPGSLSPFLPEAMYCHAPKPLYILMLEHLELQFRVASKPVAALITLLIANGTLYILLIPIVVHCTHIHPNYRIAGNFGGRKLLRISRIRKSFLCEIWECGVLWRSKSEQSTKVFSLESFPLYGSFLSLPAPPTVFAFVSTLGLLCPYIRLSTQLHSLALVLG